MNFLIRVLLTTSTRCFLIWDTACPDKYSVGELNCDCVLWQFEAISWHPFSCLSCNGEVSADGRPRNAIDLDLFYIHVVSSGNSELLNTPSPGIPSNFDFCSVPLFPYGGWENCWVYNPVVSLGMMLSWINSVVFPLLSIFLYKCCSFYCIIVVYIC